MEYGVCGSVCCIGRDRVYGIGKNGVCDVCSMECVMCVVCDVCSMECVMCVV